MKKLIFYSEKSPHYNWSPYDEYIGKILFAFLVYGEMNLYQVHKVTGLAHSTIHKKIKEAEEQGLVKVKGSSKFRTGLSSKNYDLTSEGFKFIIDRIERKEILAYPQILQQLEKRAKENPDFDPALEWWDTFMKEDTLLQSYYLDNFICFEEEFPDFIIDDLFEEQYFETTEEPMVLYHITFGSNSHRYSKEKLEEKAMLKKELFKLLQKNEKLKNAVLQRVRYLQRYYESWLKSYKEIEKKLL